MAEVNEGQCYYCHLLISRYEIILNISTVPIHMSYLIQFHDFSSLAHVSYVDDSLEALA